MLCTQLTHLSLNLTFLHKQVVGIVVKLTPEHNVTWMTETGVPDLPRYHTAGMVPVGTLSCSTHICEVETHTL